MEGSTSDKWIFKKQQTSCVDKRIGVFDESFKPDIARESDTTLKKEKRREEGFSSEIGVDCHAVYMRVYK